VHLTAKFHRPTFNRSEVIVLTNKQTPLKHPPCSAMLRRWVTRISCRWQTRTTRCITANMLQTSNVDAQGDKHANELSW